MRRIYLEHGEAYGNLGDEAMLINASRRLQKAIGDVEFIIPREGSSPLPDIEAGTQVASPDPALRKLMRRFVPFGMIRMWSHERSWDPLALLAPFLMRVLGGIGQWRDMLDHLSRCDGVYLVGAANLNDFARLPCVLPKYAIVFEALTRDIPVVVSSQTVGPLSVPWVQRAVRKMVNQVNYFSTRDCGVTRNFLAEAGVNSSSVNFSGDEAFTLPAASGGRVNSYLQDSGVGTSEPISLIHFRATDYTQQTEHHYDTLASAFDRVDTQSKLCFVPMSYGEHSGDDEACGYAIRDRMQAPEKLTVLDASTDVEVVRGLFDRANWVLGLSYHTQVFAISAACPFGLLASGEYYHTKARGVHNIVDRKMPFLSMPEATPRDLIATMEDLEANQNSHRDYLQKVRNQVLEVNDRPVQAMKSALQ
jgi:polysaccharide pyruvyl transferase WcaK-like protein